MDDFKERRTVAGRMILSMLPEDFEKLITSKEIIMSGVLMDRITTISSDGERCERRLLKKAVLMDKLLL